VRLAREMSAGIAKADPTDDPSDFHHVVQAARCPVLVRGGGKADLRKVIITSAALIALIALIAQGVQGVHGMIYGCNIYQHDNPRAVVAALMALILDGADAEKASAYYQQGGGR